MKYIFFNFTAEEVVQVEYSAVAEYFGLSVEVPPPNSENSSGEEISSVPPSNNSVIPSADDAEQATSSRQLVCWNDGETKLLLNLYREYMDQIGPLKKLKNKKQLWKLIRKTIKCRLGSDFTEIQIENRFKTVSRRHKKSIDNNRTTGASRIVPEYENEFQRIAALDDSLEPEVRMDTTSIFVKTPTNVRESVSSSVHTQNRSPPASDSEDQSGSSIPTAGPSTPTTGSSTTRRSKKVDFQAQMLEAYQQGQTEKNRRHMERMEKVDTITALLTRIAEKP